MARRYPVFPRPSYASNFTKRRLERDLERGGMTDATQRGAVVSMMSDVLRKQGADERVNYSVELGGAKPYATIAVAASDSVAPDAANADYVCDGTADDVEIQAALDDLTPGGRVVLLEGTYSLSAAVGMNVGGSSLVGIGAGTTISRTFSSSAMIFMQAARCEVAHMRLNCGDSNGVEGFQSDHSTVHDIWITGSTAQNGINLFPVAFCTVYAIHGDSSNAVEEVRLGEKSLVTGCDLFGGILVDDAYSAAVGNVIDNSGHIVVGSSGVGSVIADNVIRWASLTAIQSNASDVVIIGNSIEEPTIGIVAGGARTIIIGNRIDGTGGDGIQITGNGTIEALVVGNIIYGTSGDGIQIADFSDNNSVLSNLVVPGGSTPSGVHIVGANANANIVAGNVLRGTWATAAIIDNGTGTLVNWPAHATFGDNFT